MSYYKADYSGSMIKTQCLHDNLPLWIFFSRQSEAGFQTPTLWISLILVESKMEINFKFSEQKNFWHMKSMDIPSEKMPCCKNEDVRNKAFVT